MAYINFDVIRDRFSKQRLFEFGWERDIAKGGDYNCISFGDNWRGERSGGLILRTITFHDNLGDFYKPDHPYKGIIKYERSNGWKNTDDIIRHIPYADDFFLPATEEAFDNFVNQETYHPGEVEM